MMILRFFCLCFLVTGFGYAADGFYLGVWGGCNLVDDRVEQVDFDLDAGFATGVLAGYQRRDGLRLELEGGFRYNPMDEIVVRGVKSGLAGSLETWGALLNILYRSHYFRTVNPFYGAGAGIGYERICFNGDGIETLEFVETRLIYQIIAGLSYSLNSCTEVSLEYRFLDFDQDAFSHSLVLGFRRFF